MTSTPVASDIHHLLSSSHQPCLSEFLKELVGDLALISAIDELALWLIHRHEKIDELEVGLKA
jgi:hypothetical protein